MAKILVTGAAGDLGQQVLVGQEPPACGDAPLCSARQRVKLACEMGEALGKAYVARQFPPESKARVVELKY